MPWQTRVTQLLNIQYPIMCGGMQNVANPELAVAISEAGGLGITNISMYPDLDDFRRAVRYIRSHTDKPFAVNISMIPNVDMGEKILNYIDICGEEGVNVIESAGKSPEELVGPVHDRGMKLIHKVPAVKHALKAEAVGADIVTIVGSEAAGHPSPDLVGTMVLTNRASRLLKIPVLCGGGICDGRGFVAALALGAEGVTMGTRFINAAECWISDQHKQWIIDHSEQDTILAQRAIKNMIRAAHNAAADRCIELEKDPNCTLETLMPVISGKVGHIAYENGDIDGGIFPVGQDIGLIEDIKNASHILSDMIKEAEAVLERLDIMHC